MKRDCECPRAQHQHGTLGAYQYDGCRCFPCCLNRSHASAAYTAGQGWYEYDWRSGIGVARRLQALTAIGYTDAQMADRLGMHRSYVVRLRAHKHTGSAVTPATYDAVARLYDELWDKPYTGPYSTRTRRLAARKGWLPPMCHDDDTIDREITNPDRDGVDFPIHNIEMFVHKKFTPEIPEIIDEIAVERACLGDRVPLTKAEMSCAIDRLSDMGHSADEVARRLQISDRTVVRRRGKEAA